MENEEILGNDRPVYNDEGTIAGDTTFKTSGERIVGNANGAENKQPPGNTQGGDAQTLDELLVSTTKNGGLQVIPEILFRQRKIKGVEMVWEHLKFSGNPFKILILDYRQYKKIAPQIVENNYNILVKFWGEVNNQLDGVNRPKVTERYGDVFVPDIKAAIKTLNKAFDQLKTNEGIEDWFQKLNKERYDNGINAIKFLLDHDTKRGILYKDDALELIEIGKKNELNEEEIRGYIYNQLIFKGFSERSEIKQSDFLDNDWMSDSAFEEKKARKAVDIKVLDRPVNSLLQLGKVLYDLPERTKNEYINNVAYLPAAINLIEASDAKARVYEKIINEEKDINKRYLKIIYSLNGALPFRLGPSQFNNIVELFAETKNNSDSFFFAVDSYKKGYIQIWLNLTDKSTALKLPESKEYNAFVQFFLSVAPRHPVYLYKEKFDTPQSLIGKAKTDHSYWARIIEAMSGGLLPVWFAGIGKSNWNLAYNAATQPILNAGYYTDSDKKLACVQALIQIIDTSVSNPEITSDVSKIEALSIDASKLYQSKIVLQLSNIGFTKARVYFDNSIPGVTVSAPSLEFNSLTGNARHELNIIVNPFNLIKDKTYQVNLIVESIFQTITIPVIVKVIFPKKVYFLYLAKYGFFGALFFLALRSLLNLFTGGARAYYPTMPNFSNFMYNLPYSYFGYTAILIISILGIWGVNHLVKKIEKL